jgi:hypothetical protein
MAHVLARLRDVKFEDVKSMLKAEVLRHGEQGLYLKHIWRNADDPNEVLFIFQTNDLSRARRYVESIHAQALKENPGANLPQMTYLDDK